MYNVKEVQVLMEEVDKLHETYKKKHKELINALFDTTTERPESEIIANLWNT